MVARTHLNFSVRLLPYGNRRSDLRQMRGSMEGNQEAVEVGNMEGWEQTVDYIP